MEPDTLPSMHELVIYAADIGSVAKGNFGWARRGVPPSLDGGTDPGALVESLAKDLHNQRPVALGFECPQWMDLPDDASLLTRARVGEGNRAWCAGAGAGALATGLVQTAWILQSLRERAPSTAVYLDWAAFAASGRGLFLWEAFVSASAKGLTHRNDADIAVDAFARSLPNPSSTASIKPRGKVISLLGGALLRTGWTSDPDMLGTACVVIRAG